MQRNLERPKLCKSHGSRLFVATIATGLLVSALAVVTPTPASAAGCDLTGSGTPGDPYEVTDAAGLALVGVGDCALGASYEQTANITLPSVAAGSSNHTRIGSSSARFTGTYDGGDYEITGLRIVTTAVWPDEGFGLFGAVGATAVLSNIRLVDARVTADTGAVGGLVGQSLGRIERSSVVGGSIRGTYFVGGLVGNMENSCGPNSALIRESFSTAQVTGSATGYAGAGGLVGGAGTCTTIEQSFASGAVTGGGWVGGLVGDALNVTIRDSYASGATTGTEYVGGLVGQLRSSGGTAEIVRSYASGAVSGTLKTGGLVGDFDNTSVITTASFWDLDTTGQAASDGGAGRTSAAMRQLATFADAPASWSIVSGWQAPNAGSPVWGLDCNVNGGYPYLIWESDDGSYDGKSIGQPCPTGGSGTTSDEPTPSQPLLIGGVPPAVPTGSGAWVQADGTSTPLVVSSPAANQLRYEAEGVRVTLTGTAASSPARGLVAGPAGEIVCEVCVPASSGQVIEVWMFSTPRLVAAHRVDDTECHLFAIPLSAPLDGQGAVSAGAHTLQLAIPTSSGMQAVNVGVTVGGLVPASVPAGEGPVPSGAVVLALFAAAGVLLTGRRLVTAG